MTKYQDPTVELAALLISEHSISPDQTLCQEIIKLRLEKIGFTTQEMEVDGAKNLWARIGAKAPLVVFSGHTDVVGPGDLNQWKSSPFIPTERQGKLFGRGAADMKGSVAAMITAVESFLAESTSTELPLSIGFLITGNEEISGTGAKTSIDHLYSHDQIIDYCIVGEPTSEKILGDTIKIGRCGSLNARIEFVGIQGHTGYPHLADNAAHKAIAPLLSFIDEEWDVGDDFFQPSTRQITSLIAGVAGNVIPGTAVATLNFRHSIRTSSDEIKARVETILKKHAESSFNITWTTTAEPFLTNPGHLTKIISDTIEETLGIVPEYATGGGSSDARFFAARGIMVVEFGPINETIHQCNEHALSEDLIKLSDVYKKFLLNLQTSLQ